MTATRTDSPEKLLARLVGPENLDALAFQGFVSHSRRANGAFSFKLRFRANGKQRVRYLGSDALYAATIHVALRKWQMWSRRLRAFAQKLALARRLQQQIRRQMAKLIGRREADSVSYPAPSPSPISEANHVDKQSLRPVIADNAGSRRIARQRCDRRAGDGQDPGQRTSRRNDHGVRQTIGPRLRVCRPDQTADARRQRQGRRRRRRPLYPLFPPGGSDGERRPAYLAARRRAADQSAAQRLKNRSVIPTPPSLLTIRRCEFARVPPWFSENLKLCFLVSKVD